MSREKFESNMKALMDQMSQFMSTKTVVGEPIHINDVIIVPLIDVFFGAGVGGFENAEEKLNQDSTGGGVGGKISPTAVIVVMDGTAQMIHVKEKESMNKLIDMIPGILNKLNLGNFSKKETAEDDTDDIEIIFEQDFEDDDFLNEAEEDDFV